MSNHRIRIAYQRNHRALALRPGKGLGTARTTIRLRDGLRCEVEDGPWRLDVDMGESAGGAGGAPTPGVLGRAALGSCLAVCYAQMAAVEGVELEDVAIDVEADYDARGETGFPEVSAGYSEVRLSVTLTSLAPREDIDRIVALAEANSSFLEVFREPQRVVRQLEVRRPTGARA